MGRKVRRVTANLPANLLESAMRATGKGITDTIVEGLEHIKRRHFYEKLMALRGKTHFDTDVDDLRGRRRR